MFPPPPGFNAPSAPPPPPPPPPFAAWGAAPGWAFPAPPQRHRTNYDVVGRATPPLLLGALLAGVSFDVMAHNGLVTLSGTLFTVVLAALLLATGRVRSLAGVCFLASAALLSVTFTWRASPWVTSPALCAIVVLVLWGASLARAGSVRATFPALAGRLRVAFGHLTRAPGMLRSVGDGGSAEEPARRRGNAVARGLALAMPVVLVIGMLLSAADPVFRSWFDPPLLLQHLVLVGIGGWLLVGLFRAASASQPTVDLAAAPRLGTTEAASVLGALCALYAAFVAAQVVALSGGAQHVLATQGLTYADYARQGFFQLLAAATLTLIVLLGVRACSERARLSLTLLCESIVALTLAVVVVAIRRLQLYEAAYGLTMLRLASTVTAAWIGLVFTLLGIAIARRRSANLWFAPAVVLAAVAFTAGWAAVNPAGVVARTNLQRAAHGRPLDIAQTVSLGPDALPAIFAGAAGLDRRQADTLRFVVCNRRTMAGNGAAFNAAEHRAGRALADECHSGA